MLKRYLLLLVGIGIISMLGFGGSYTAPTFDSVNFSLCSGYTAPSLESINFTLGESDSCVVDTCSCAGLNNNWEVDMGDFCVIVDDCNLGTGKLSFINSGNFTIDAIINTTDMGDPGNGAIVWMNDEGLIEIDG